MSIYDSPRPLEAEREQLEKLASRWVNRADEASDKLLDKEDFSVDELLTLAFSAVVDRLNPQDPAEFSARKALGKEVFERPMKQPEFFTMVLVAILSLEQSCREGHSLSVSTLLAPAMRSIGRAISKPDWLNENFSKAGIFGLYKKFLEVVSEKAKEAVGLDLKYFPRSGDLVDFRGFRLPLERFNFDGTITLKADYKTMQNFLNQNIFHTACPALEILSGFSKKMEALEGANFELEVFGGQAAKDFIHEIKRRLDESGIPYINKDFQEVRKSFFDMIKGRSAKEKIRIRITWTGDSLNLEELI